MATPAVDAVSDKAIFTGEAKFVVLPGEAGELGILPGHTPADFAHTPGTVRSSVPTKARKHLRRQASSRCSRAAGPCWPIRPSGPPT